MLHLTLEGKIKAEVEGRIRDHLRDLVRQSLHEKVRDKVKEEVCVPLFTSADGIFIVISLQSRFQTTCNNKSLSTRGRLSKFGRHFIIRKKKIFSLFINHYFNDDS